MADIDFKLGAYYDPSLTPMAMLVDVNQMEILNIQIGAQLATLETLIISQLDALGSSSNCVTKRPKQLSLESLGVEEGDVIDNLSFTNIDGSFSTRARHLQSDR